MDQLLQVENFIIEHQMLKPGMQVVLGVSGGADSICLLEMLYQLKDKYALTLTVVHVHHGIRGAAADEDAAFVEAFCDERKIECILCREDVPALAAAWHMTEEEAGRKVRYQCFEQVLSARQADVIAVAHHMDDLAETILFNLFRGSGLKGLTGMAPVRDKIIRPLLCLSRQDVEDWLYARRLNYCTDTTNLEPTYARNRIRLELMPYIRTHLNPQAVTHILAAGDSVREALDYIEDSAMAAFTAARTQKGALLLEVIRSLPPVILKEVLRLWFESHTGQLKDVSRVHILMMAELMDKPEGKVAHLPYRQVAIRRQTVLELMDEAQYEAAKEASEVIYHQSVQIPGTYQIPGTEMILSFSVRPRGENERIPENNCTKWFDYDKIKDGLELRYRSSGDYMTIAPDYRRKRLRRILIDDKIPAELRPKLCVLAAGEHVLWIPNGRISEVCKVSSGTEKLLMVDIKGENTWKTRSVCY